MKLYFIAGEASGDSRGAELIESLRAREENLECFGLGGRQMRALSQNQIEDWCERAAVLGFIDVLKNYGYFRKRFHAALEEIVRLKPDAVILIDYPGFNLRIAKALRKRDPNQKIIYYISPQVWAWDQGRIPQMAKMLDLMLCIFPFEKPLYEQSGLRTEFVGHPMVDSLNAKRAGVPMVPREDDLVALLPGSRKREVTKIFPAMVQAALLMAKQRPQTRFAAAAASPEMQELMQRILSEHAKGLHCEITLRNAHELMQRAAAGMVASGTATLEAAFFRLPYVLVYKAAWLTFFIGRRLVKVQWLGIVNILAGREIVREFLQEEARPEAMAAEVLGLMQNPSKRAEVMEAIEEVLALLGPSGASGRAAEAALSLLKAER